jgi:tripartite-type tricarboxylate transporter receptor subunit TctC
MENDCCADFFNPDQTDKRREGMMKVRVGKKNRVLIFWVIVLAFSSVAWAQNDMIDRAISQSLQKILKQPAIIQNFPGGGGALVLGKIKTEKPDGYSLFQTGTAMYSRTPYLRSVPYDPLKDFAYLAQHAMFQFCIVDRGDNPWKNYDEMIAYARKNPNTVKYSTSGVGSSMHLIMEYIAMREGLKWIHVPFTGGTEALAALLGGHVQVYSASLGTEVEQLRSGRIRFLLSTNPKRNTIFSDAPTVLEKGYDFAVVSGACWTVPAGTPKDIQRKLENALLQSFKDPSVEEVINKWNMVIEPLNGESLQKMIVKDYQINGELMKQLGLGIYKK